MAFSLPRLGLTLLCCSFALLLTPSCGGGGGEEAGDGEESGDNGDGGSGGSGGGDPADNTFGEFDLPQSTDLTTITSAWTGFLANGSAESEMYWAGQNSADNLSDSTPFIGHAHADDQADGPPAKEWAFSYAASDANIDQEINAVIGLTGGGALAAGSYDQSGGDQGAWIFRVNDSGSKASWAEGAFTDSGDMIAGFFGVAESKIGSDVAAVGTLYAASAPTVGPGIAVLFDSSGNSLSQLTVGNLATEDVDLEAILPVSDGGWLALGRVLENGESFYAGLVLKLDSNFSVVEWEMSYAASQDLSFIGALESADGSNFTLVGESFVSSGPTITDLIQISSTDGSVVWKKQYAILGQDEVCSLYSLIEDGNSLWAFGHTDISNGSGGFTNLPLLLKINKGNGAIQIERNYSNMGDAFFVAGMNTLSANATAADFLITGIMDGDNQDAFAVYGLSENGVPSFVGGDCSSLTGVDNGVVSFSDLSLSALNRGDSSSLTTLTTTSVDFGKADISFSLKTDCPD